MCPALPPTPVPALRRVLLDLEATRYIPHAIATVRDSGVEVPHPANRESRPQLGVGEALAKVAVQSAHQPVAELSILLSLSYSRGGEGYSLATQDQSALGPKEVL
jgi:hypothetical protein